ARWSLSLSLRPASRACRSCSIALLAICFACSTFIFPVLLFRGVLAPFTHSRGSEDAKQGTEAKRLARPGRNGPHARVTLGFGGAKRASGDRRRAIQTRGRANLEAQRTASETGKGSLRGLRGTNSHGQAKAALQCSRISVRE